MYWYNSVRNFTQIFFMRKIQSLFIISALLFVASPMANAEEGNIQYTATQRKCMNLSNNREKIRCLYNNRRVRRYDLRAYVRQTSESMTTANREAFQQQTDRWNKSRSILRNDCKSTLGLFTASSRATFQRCIQERSSAISDRNEDAIDMQRGILRRERNRIKDYGTTRRTFRQNALRQQMNRKRDFAKRGMVELNRDRYNPDLGNMEDEDNEDSDK